jgi:hypothetical protein
VVYRRELRPVLTTGAEAMDRLFQYMHPVAARWGNMSNVDHRRVGPSLRCRSVELLSEGPRSPRSDEPSWAYVNRK